MSTEMTFHSAKRAVAEAQSHHESAARAIYAGLRKGELTQTQPMGREFNDHDRKARALRLALEILEAVK